MPKAWITENTDELISKLIFCDELTESQKENLSFHEIVKIGKQANCEEPRENKMILSLIKKHHQKYSYMFCAYGEAPCNLKFYVEKYKNMEGTHFLRHIVHGSIDIADCTLQAAFLI